MLKQVKGLYKLSRPFSTLTGILATFLGGYVAGTGNWGAIALACLATMFVSAAANAWNDYRDIEIDRINQPQRPLPSGMVSLRAARNFSFIMAALSMIVAALISWPAFFVSVASNILLYLYSMRLKSTVLLGNVTVALISALSPVFGGIAAGNVTPSLWLALIIFFGILSREILKTLADYDGDAHNQVKTISTVWGPRVARTAFFTLAGLSSVAILAPYVFEYYRPVYAYIVTLGFFPIAVYVIVRVTRDRTGPQLETLSQILKYDFLLWFVAVFVGAAI